MTVLPPIPGTPPTPTITVTWHDLTSTTTDNIGSIDVRLDISPKPTAPFWLRFTVPSWAAPVAGVGVGEYDFDYRLVGPVGPATADRGINTYRVRIQPGATQVQMKLEINENLDPSETYAMTIVANGYYLIGAKPTHTCTCTVGHTQPTANNVGHGIVHAMTGDGDDWQSSHAGDILENKRMKFEAQPNHPNCLVRNNWIKYLGAFQKSHVYNHYEGDAPSPGTIVEWNTVGGVQQGSTNGGTGITGIAMPPPGWKVRFNHIHKLGADGIKECANSEIYDNYIHQLGGGLDAHGDSWQLDHVSQPLNILFHHNNCYQPWPSTNAGIAEGGTTWEVSSVFQFAADAVVDDNVLIYSNWLDGGGDYMFTVGQNSGHVGAFRGLTFKNNRIGIQRKFYANLAGGETDDEIMAMALQSLFNTDTSYSGGHRILWRGNKWGGENVPASYQGRPIFTAPGTVQAPAF